MIKKDKILHVYDLINGSKVKKYFDFYRSTLSWNRNQIVDYQNLKLKELVKYAFEKIPFYRQRFEKNNLTPGSIKNLEDLKKIPPLTRLDIQDNSENLIDKEGKSSSYRKSSSSGTTGIPITYYKDMDGFSAGVAAGYLCWALSGWNFRDKSLHIWGNPASVLHWNTLRSKLKRLAFNQKNLAATVFNDTNNYPDVIKFINKYKPRLIDGYSASIFNLANYIKTNNFQIHKPGYIFTTAENLLTGQKRIIEDTLGPVSDIYGCGEINGIAAQPIHKNKYFIIEPHVIVEVCSSEKDEHKEIIVTDLDSKFMPFIRYQVGDLIDDVYEPELRNDLKFKYFKKIFGRTADIIDLGNGKKILPVNLLAGTIFREIGGILKHKVVWNGEYLNFIFEITGDFSLQRAYQVIESELKLYNTKFKIEPVKKLNPDKNGKFRYVEIKK